MNTDQASILTKVLLTINLIPHAYLYLEGLERDGCFGHQGALLNLLHPLKQPITLSLRRDCIDLPMRLLSIRVLCLVRGMTCFLMRN